MCGTLIYMFSILYKNQNKLTKKNSCGLVITLYDLLVYLVNFNFLRFRFLHYNIVSIDSFLSQIIVSFIYILRSIYLSSPSKSTFMLLHFINIIQFNKKN